MILFWDPARARTRRAEREKRHFHSTAEFLVYGSGDKEKGGLNESPVKANLGLLRSQSSPFSRSVLRPGGHPNPVAQYGRGNRGGADQPGDSEQYRHGEVQAQKHG